MPIATASLAIVPTPIFDVVPKRINPGSDRSRGPTAACFWNSARHAALKSSNGSSPAVGARHPYRGAGLDVVWQPFAILFAIGAMLFGYALARFRGTIGMMV